MSHVQGIPQDRDTWNLVSRRRHPRVGHAPKTTTSAEGVSQTRLQEARESRQDVLHDVHPHGFVISAQEAICIVQHIDENPRLVLADLVD